MTRVDLRFTPENEDLLLTGKKRATLRRSRHGKVGDTFEVKGRVFELTSIRPVPLGDALRLYYPMLGMPNTDAAYENLARAYGLLIETLRGSPDFQVVYVHVFIPKAVLEPGTP